jgi:hypothetical protein
MRTVLRLPSGGFTLSCLSWLLMGGGACLPLRSRAELHARAPLPCRAVLTLQSFSRMLPIRRAFLTVRRATVTIQAAERGRAARQAFAELRRRHRAALCVQVRLALRLQALRANFHGPP